MPNVEPHPKKDISNQRTSISQIYNTQFVIETELDAIGKLSKESPELADRAMKLLEESLEHRKCNDKQILSLEQQNLKIKEKNFRSFHFWNGFAMISHFIITCLFWSGGIYLLINGYELGAYFNFALGGILPFLPKISVLLKNKLKS
ncbi:hypothetical protein [Campylobacter cuniculorum]|uniref:hypothetical protein n=1 Tax=Campylobacter cuniculorum TaxID=374106 RepID=UPI0023EFD32B|nr:hypothetical protein [Campylobacter cuniculorum]